MELVILAAGMGSRFGGLKQMEPIDEYGNFILDYSIYDAIEAGFDTVVFIIKEEFYNDFRNTVGKRIESKIKTKYAFQKLDDLPRGYKCPQDRVKPWGTGHAILAARDVIEGNFVIINADDYYGKESFALAANYLKQMDKNAKGVYANVVYQIENTMTENGAVKRGVCIQDENGKFKGLIESLVEKKDDGSILATSLENSDMKFVISKDHPVSMNMFVFTKDILEELERLFPIFLNKNKDKYLTCEYLIPSVVTDLFENKKATLDLIPTVSVWHGITYKEDKADVVASLKKLVGEGKYKEGLWK